MPDTISASVGAGGMNRAEDVLLIQQLLNQRGTFGLVENGQNSPQLVAAIEKFQAGFLDNPDGRVDPGGRTFRKLSGDDKSERGFVQLPRDIPGVYSYDEPRVQWGTPNCIKMVQEVAAALRLTHPDFEFGAGRLSLENGGKLPPHSSHKAGLNVDIRPLRTDRGREPVTIHDSEYSRALTRLLVDALLAHPNVKSILFNDSKIPGVSPFDGHDNHLHITCKK